jgi:uncharacterized protein YacL
MKKFLLNNIGYITGSLLGTIISIFIYDLSIYILFINFILTIFISKFICNVLFNRRKK